MASDKKTAAGNTSMLLLQLLSERDMYGYEMIETLGKRS
ncbi:MAG: PadR family transcriptional regulator, partial [[Clostridium] symbiosum]|nr:PadR family transcriptional regulator [[Clostridium] symbiosum]